MKKLLFALLLTCSTLSFAQSFHYGPRFGLSSSSISISNIDEPVEDQLGEGSNKFGFHVGGFLRAQLLGFYIQPELLYSRINGEIDFFGVKEEIAINRIDMPVMVGKRFLKLVRLQAGPVFSFPLSSDVEVDGESVDDVYDQITAGYQVGVGLDLFKLIVDLKYEGSFNNISENLGDFKADQRVNQVLLTIGWKM